MKQIYSNQSSQDTAQKFQFANGIRHIKIYNLSSANSIDYNCDNGSNWLHMPPSLGYDEFDWLFDPLDKSSIPIIYIKSTNQGASASFQIAGW